MFAAKAEEPTATFTVPVVFATIALWPTAVLFAAVVLEDKEPSPIAVLYVPLVFAVSATLPTAVLLEDVLTFNASLPIAMQADPVLLVDKASYPIATL